MQTRVATGADAAAIARVHVAAWQVAYRGLMPDTILDTLDPGRRTVRWREILAQPQGITFVAEADFHIVGFSNLIPSRDLEVDPKSVAEIAAIYVHPDFWRAGIGRALCSLALREARDRKFSFVTLWVLKTNIPAMKFYQTMGFTPDGATKSEKLRDFELHELRLRFHL